MKQPQYAVKSYEYWPVTVEEFDPEERETRTRRRTIRHQMTTLCNSAEDAETFLRDIKLRKYPNISKAWYAGRVL